MQRGIIISGAIIGLLAAFLVKLGNPVNMGVCVACFYRDIVGALGLHKAEAVQYIRPEIIGFILGAFILAVLGKDFKARGGSSPLIRFVLGFFVMIGALVFLGCPLRMILRLANGDLNALVGVLGFVFGIMVGIQFIKGGFTLGRSYKQAPVNGYIMPLLALALLVLAFLKPSFINFSESGPGATHAPLVFSLAVGLIIGAIVQRTRLCTVGGFRDALLIKDFHLFKGLLSIFIFALLGNLLFNPASFKIGFVGQPIAHNDILWNFLGMTLAGLGSVLLGGCPLRQTILSAEGDTDAAVTVFGLMAGAAFAHNFGLAASPQGVPGSGQVAVVIGLVVVLAIAGLTTWLKMEQREIKGKEGVPLAR